MMLVRMSVDPPIPTGSNGYTAPSLLTRHELSYMSQKQNIDHSTHHSRLPISPCRTLYTSTTAKYIQKPRQRWCERSGNRPQTPGTERSWTSGTDVLT